MSQCAPNWDDVIPIYSPTGILLAVSYTRIVIGERGPYLEFSQDNLNWLEFKVPEDKR